MNGQGGDSRCSLGLLPWTQAEPASQARETPGEASGGQHGTDGAAIHLNYRHG